MADAALISGLLSNLAPLIKDDFSLFWSFKKEVEKLSSTLSSITAVLEDAERKNVQEKDKQTEDWLRKLKDVAYEVRDIMDDCTYEDLRLQVNRRNASSSTRIKVTNSITHPFSTTRTRFKVGRKIKKLQEKLYQISLESQNLHLNTCSWRETTSLSPSLPLSSSNQVYVRDLSSSNQVYGRDNEKEQIIDIIFHTSRVDNKLSVLPIVGIGGLGKTTLAQMIFNDEEIANHFDIKIWVCVSDKFDIKLVIKAIIGATNETSLEILHKIVRDILSWKRFLIVLDDVWNKNVDAWNEMRSILDCGSNGSFILTTTRKRNVAKIMETIQHFQLSLLSNDDCWLLLEEHAFMHGIPKTPNFVDIGKEIVLKCKGVPLVAKTLGRQLGSKSDVNEWYRIRDNELWEIHEQTEDLREFIHDSKIDKFTSSERETMSLSSCNQVYGRDNEKKQIIDILVNTSRVDNKLSVLPIVGIGGLGKTTLAQMIFNDEEIANHFDIKIWVCVSDKFDIKLVIKVIIGATNETSLEILHKIVRDILSWKRFLIVLDDVWNENVDAWNEMRSILDCGSNGSFVLATARKRNVAEIMKTIQHFQLSLLSNNDCWLLLEERAFMHGIPKTPNFVDIGREISRRCKGVPLVAKILGGQLGSKSDVNEWCKIRDSELWEVAQNEEFDPLHIIRLSYYDLPYYSRKCFVFCAIFPKDNIIEKERLIQLWMANDLLPIPIDKNQEMEDVGNTI